jgi:hypothetical protein
VASRPPITTASSHPGRVLQPRLVDVEVQPVDALHLERDVLGQDIGDAAGYRHHKLRSWIGPRATYRHRAVSMTGSTLPV